MVGRAICLKLLRSTTYRRCFSTETAAVETISTPAISQRKRISDGRRKLSDLINRADSESNIKDALNKLDNEGESIQKIDIVGCINNLRRTDRFDLALQVSIFHLRACFFLSQVTQLSIYHYKVYIFHGDVFPAIFFSFPLFGCSMINVYYDYLRLIVMSKCRSDW